MGNGASVTDSRRSGASEVSGSAAEALATAVAVVSTAVSLGAELAKHTKAKLEQLPVCVSVDGHFSIRVRWERLGAFVLEKNEPQNEIRRVTLNERISAKTNRIVSGWIQSFLLSGRSINLQHGISTVLERHADQKLEAFVSHFCNVLFPLFQIQPGDQQTVQNTVLNSMKHADIQISGANPGMLGFTQSKVCFVAQLDLENLLNKNPTSKQILTWVTSMIRQMNPGGRAILTSESG